MSDLDQNREDRIRRADRARELLNNSLLQDAFKDVREGLVLTAETCNWSDHDTKTNVMLSLQLLRNLKKIIEDHITDGKVAQSEIERLNNPKVRRVGAD